MTRIVQRTVLFADLRGSTALFEKLGNAEATSVVTRCTAAVGKLVPDFDGTLIKTLGDGLMATFATPQSGVLAAVKMHDVLEAMVSRGHQRGASRGMRSMRLQVALASGEVVEMGGDCYGDAVNVAARMIDRAGDNETLVTGEVFAGLTPEWQSRFRSLDRLALRGRVEPVQVHVLGGRRGNDTAATQFGDIAPALDPDGIRLAWRDEVRVFACQQMPVVLGRHSQSAFWVDDSRVSRSHARLEWHGSSFQLTDLSYNGTYVQFGDSEVVSLRRGSCLLHGTGLIGLGGSPNDATSPCVSFEVLRFGDTQPHHLGDDPRLA